MSKDYKRTAESKANTNSIRTQRRQSQAERKFTDRSFAKLLAKGL
ncbi:hypothetical protein SEA_WATERT_118 [Microbacterium phage WaterT]|nr:hypothetical protein SEA_WATERT_118 [Microbacterium phage WaterT]